MLPQSESGATRVSLIARAKERDSQAWSELVDLYGPLVAHWCSRCGLNAQQTSDCVQEVFASVARSLGEYEAQKASGAFRSWMWTITSNKVKDLHRRNRQQPLAQGGSTAMMALQQVPSEGDLPDTEPTDAEQLGELITRGLEQVRGEFEPRTWDIFRRAVLDQIATAVVAQEFCITPGGVRQIRSRVLRRLRQQLGDIDV